MHTSDRGHGGDLTHSPNVNTPGWCIGSGNHSRERKERDAVGCLELPFLGIPVLFYENRDNLGNIVNYVLKNRPGITEGAAGARQILWYYTDQGVKAALDGVHLSQRPKPGRHDIDVAFMGL